MFCDHLNDIFHMEKGRDLWYPSSIR
jgi:hypothetical protein